MSKFLCDTCVVREIAQNPDIRRVRALGVWEYLPTGTECRCGLNPVFELYEDGEPYNPITQKAVDLPVESEIPEMSEQWWSLTDREMSELGDGLMAFMDSATGSEKILKSQQEVIAAGARSYPGVSGLRSLASQNAQLQVIADAQKQVAKKLLEKYDSLTEKSKTSVEVEAPRNPLLAIHANLSDIFTERVETRLAEKEEVFAEGTNPFPIEYEGRTVGKGYIGQDRIAVFQINDEDVLARIRDGNVDSFSIHSIGISYDKATLLNNHEQS